MNEHNNRQHYMWLNWITYKHTCVLWITVLIEQTHNMLTYFTVVSRKPCCTHACCMVCILASSAILTGTADCKIKIYVKITGVYMTLCIFLNNMPWSHVQSNNIYMHYKDMSCSHRNENGKELFQVMVCRIGIRCCHCDVAKNTSLCIIVEQIQLLLSYCAPLVTCT